jgi:hypothetical protein
MKTKLILLLCFFAGLHSFAQKKDKNTDNYSYIKLYITNADHKILLLKWGETWEVPGARYSAPFTLSKFIDTLCAEDGLKVKDTRLSGMFTFQYEGQKKLAVMQYYTAVYASGSPRVPAGCSDIRWFTVQEALDILTFDDMKMIIRKINEDPLAIWGGALYKKVDRQTNQPLIQVTEPFYRLN